MGYPKTNMVFNNGNGPDVVDAVSNMSVSTINKALKLKAASRHFVPVQVALKLQYGYTGPFDGSYTPHFASTLDECWSEQFGSEPSGKYNKDAQGGYNLAFIRDLLDADTRYSTNGPDYPPVVA